MGIKVYSSSSDEIYDLTFKVQNGKPLFICKCGHFRFKRKSSGSICPHERTILASDLSILVNQDDGDEVLSLLAKIENTTILELAKEANNAAKQVKIFENELDEKSKMIFSLI